MIPLRGAGRDYQLVQQNDTGLTDDQFESVRSAVNIARDHQVKTTKNLISLMETSGYTRDQAEWAVQYWASNLVENHRW